MKISRSRTVASARWLAAFLIIVAVPGLEPVLAGPNCSKNPDHPKCSGGGEPPPPTGCSDVFPGFVYTKPSTRKSPAGLYLASSDGCRGEFVGDVPDLRSGARLHVTTDLRDGVLVWVEEPGNNAQRVVVQRNFAVAADGTLTLDDAVRILPLPGEEPVAGDEHHYFSLDVWGGDAASERYLTVYRVIVPGGDNSQTTGELLIYNLNDLLERRVIFTFANGAPQWSGGCPAGVPHPQFVPTCYSAGSASLNPSGTRLYFADNIDDPEGSRWDATLRIDVAMNGALADWIFGDPEMVLAGQSEEPHALLARPDPDRLNLPYPEILAVGYLDRSGNNTVAARTFLDADRCAGSGFYADLADGNTAAPSDFWMGCVAPGLFAGDAVHAWQSPDSFLTRRLENRHRENLYRQYVSGALAGTEELIIENATNPDTGL